MPDLVTTAVPGYRLSRPCGTPGLPDWTNIDSMTKAHRRTVIALGFLLAWCACACALDPTLDVSQYGHTAWTARDGFSVGAIFAMAQTPDGYLWLGSEFGLYRFDGVQPVLWQPPAGQQLPNKPYALLVTRDGTLWIGTFEGLVSWRRRKADLLPGNWQSVRHISTRRPRRNGLGGRVR